MRSHLAQHLIRDLDLVQEDLAALLRRAAEHGLLDGPRLLEDFLEHEMLVSGLLRHDRIPRHLRALLRYRPPRIIGELDPRRGNHRHFLVAKEHDVARVAQDGGNVRRDEKFPVAQSDNNGGTVADGDNLVGIVGRDQHQREETAHVQQRAPNGILETVVFHLALDQMRDDLGVGLGDELVAFLLELLFQVEVVFDDAVVDDHDSARAVAVRVGILLSRPPVRRPSRVPNPVLAIDRRRRNHLFEACELAGASPQIDGAVANHRNTRRIVAAVFEAA